MSNFVTGHQDSTGQYCVQARRLLLRLYLPLKPGTEHVPPVSRPSCTLSSSGISLSLQLSPSHRGRNKKESNKPCRQGGIELTTMGLCPGSQSSRSASRGSAELATLGSMQTQSTSYAMLPLQNVSGDCWCIFCILLRVKVMLTSIESLKLKRFAPLRRQIMRQQVRR